MSSPIFTKRHYRIIAAAIHAVLRLRQTAPDHAAAQAAADELEHTNPEFDRERFVAACLDGCDTHVGGRNPNPKAQRRPLAETLARKQSRS